MYRLLVVDDEVIIADGLYEVFQNIKHPELDVYKAYSGEEALDLLNRTRIDIVLTDIHMPGIDGLQLLQKIHGNWPRCRVIFLTGYNDFDYVYTAIQYEGVSYLLKTEGYGKVIKAVENAVGEIEKGLKAEELIQKANEQLGTTMELLQKEYFIGLLKGEFSAQDINQRQFTDLEVLLSAEVPVLMLMGRVDNLPKGISYSEKSRLMYSIKLISEQYFSSPLSCVQFVNENPYLIWLIQPGKKNMDNEEEENGIWNKLLNYIKGNLEMVQAACSESLGVLLSFALDDSPAAWKEGADRFSALKMLLNYRIGQGSGMLLTDKSIVANGLQQPVSSRRERPDVRQFKFDILADFLEHGQKEDFMRMLEELTAHLKEIRSMHDIVALEIYHSTALIFLSYINRWNAMEKIAFKIGLHKLMQVEEHETWSSAVEYLKTLGDVLFDIQDSEQEKRAQDVIGRVQNYISNNVHEALSLVMLADMVHFNPSYLSRLFKQVTGINLLDYIADMRVKKAKQLLENADNKIHEIAEAVGYGSASNFARFFKKLTGLTPQEYRSSIMTK